jgi:hypothetical protein
MQVGERTVDRWLGGKKHKPLITHFKLGGVRRISAESALQFILDHTIQGVGVTAGARPRLADEDVELFLGRISRLFETMYQRKEAA